MLTVLASFLIGVSKSNKKGISGPDVFAVELGHHVERLARGGLVGVLEHGEHEILEHRVELIVLGLGVFVLDVGDDVLVQLKRG